MRVELDVRQPLVLPPGEGVEIASDALTVTESTGGSAVRFDEYLRRHDAGEDGRRCHESFDVYEVEVT